jgi:hypothetical protein
VDIDDPVAIEIRQAKEDLEERSYVPDLVTALGLSAAAAASLAHFPVFSHIVTTLLASNPRRFEKRIIRIAAALEEQQKNIASKIPDRRYYESEEFHSLVILVLEKLHSTHQDEKLKMFGEALANSGTVKFVAEDKEQYIRTLQDLSLEDLRALRQVEEFNKRPSHVRSAGIPKRENPSLSRLTSLGLIYESLKLRDFNLNIPVVPVSRQSPEAYTRGLADAVKHYLQQAPQVTYRLSGFGGRFLVFITSGAPEDKPAE